MIQQKYFEIAWKQGKSQLQDILDFLFLFNNFFQSSFHISEKKRTYEYVLFY